MCAIMGYWDPVKNADLSAIEKMKDILHHRGPNDSGTDFFNIACSDKGISNLAVGFDRLSIRDLSPAGHQPMHNVNDDIVLAFNGEIYNADELRPELINKGYSFRGGADTEVLLHMYEEYGIDETLRRLDGMYAICIVDKRHDCFYLVRDRLGEKPLCYYKTEQGILFASEYKAFYCHSEFKVELNEDAVDEYFLFRYVAGGDTMLKGVKNLTPGSYIKVDNNGITHYQYWSLPDVKPNTNTFEENKRKYAELLQKSLRRRLIADRKVGLQLSGGVDSSYMAHLISQEIDEPLQTFGIKFEDESLSEEKYMDVVIQHTGAVGHKYVFDYDMLFNYWKECTWFFEAPMNHEGTLGLLYLNKEAEKHVTVMLCGEGADESLGGYGRFAEMARALQGKFTFWRLMRMLASYIKGHVKPRLDVYDYFICSTEFVSERMFKQIRPKNKNAIKQVIGKRRAILKSMPGKGVRQCMNYETVTYMQDILMRADKVSMAASIEARVPYIMPKLIEFNCSIPDEHLVHASKIHSNQETKRLLKSLCSDVYGDAFTYRTKNGFGVPILELLRDERIVKYVEDTILPGIERRGVLNYNAVKNIWDTRYSGKYTATEYQQTLWCAISFEMWAQMYIDDSPLNYSFNKSEKYG